MPDAWEVLVAGSTLGAGHDAWEHLNAQGGGGGGGTVIVGGELFADMPRALGAEVITSLSSNLVSPRLEADSVIALSASLVVSSREAGVCQ